MAKPYAKDQPAGFTNRIEKVAIVGAGGHVGGHILKGLQQCGNFTVRALTRATSTSKLPQGIEVFPVDYDDESPDSAVIRALQGQQALIVTMAVAAPPGTLSRLIRAAAKAGVPYILPNWFGHDAANDKLCQDSWLKQRLDDTCREIESLGVSSYFLLGCNFWYEWSLGLGADRFGFDFKERSLTWFDEGDVFLTVTTWPQVGRAIAGLLSLKEFPEDSADTSATLSQFSNRSFYIESFRLNQRDMFESVKRVTKTADADWSFTKESPMTRWSEANEELKKGNFAAFPKMLYSRMFFPEADGDLTARHKFHNKVLGLPDEDLDAATAIAIEMAFSPKFAEAGH